MVDKKKAESILKTILFWGLLIKCIVLEIQVGNSIKIEDLKKLSKPQVEVIQNIKTDEKVIKSFVVAIKEVNENLAVLRDLIYSQNYKGALDEIINLNGELNKIEKEYKFPVEEQKADLLKLRKMLQSAIAQSISP